MDRDPVCGAQIRPGMEAASITYAGQTFHFCSVECKKLFAGRPKDYLKQSQEEPARST